MRYLILMPDYTQSCIKDEYNGYLEYEELNLPQDVIDEINSWHFAYKEFIPLSEKQRKSKMEEIELLDKQGINIAKKIISLCNFPLKIKYFSEGKLKYIPIV